MSNTSLRTIAIVGLFAMLSVVSARAQSGVTIEASIPFDFAAGDAKLKSGDYTVKRISKDTLLLRSADERTSVMIMAPVAIQQARTDAPERLVFNRYGNEYFLTQVWTNRAADGRGLYPSKNESRLAKQLAKTKARPEAVEIIARAK
jgi:hypothetical protein